MKSERIKSAEKPLTLEGKQGEVLTKCLNLTYEANEQAHSKARRLGEIYDRFEKKRSEYEGERKERKWGSVRAETLRERKSES